MIHQDTDGRCTACGGRSARASTGGIYWCCQELREAIEQRVPTVVAFEHPEAESPYVVESRLRQELEDAKGRQRSADIAVTLAETALGKFLNPDACRTSIACLIHNGCHRCGESK